MPRGRLLGLFPVGMEQHHVLVMEEHIEDAVGADPHLPELPVDLPEGYPSGHESALSDLGQGRRNDGLVGPRQLLDVVRHRAVAAGRCIVSQAHEVIIADRLSPGKWKPAADDLVVPGDILSQSTRRGCR